MFNGVREGTGAALTGSDENGSAKRKRVSLRESLELITDPRNLDATVEEIFQMMLGIDCRRATETVLADAESGTESLTAVVGLGGALSGACIFRSGAMTARKIAGLMTGMEFENIDDTVKDGMGEICNMLAGAWKGRVPELAAHCGLSVPAVIVGHDYSLHVQAPEFQLHHLYRFEDATFEVTIVCDGLK
jgi:chemotaxis protein CheX